MSMCSCNLYAQLMRKSCRELMFEETCVDEEGNNRELVTAHMDMWKATGKHQKKALCTV